MFRFHLFHSLLRFDLFIIQWFLPSPPFNVKEILVGDKVVVAEAAKVDGLDVADVDAAEEVKVMESEADLATESGRANGRVVKVRGVVRL